MPLLEHDSQQEAERDYFCFYGLLPLLHCQRLVIIKAKRRAALVMMENIFVQLVLKYHF